MVYLLCKRDRFLVPYPFGYHDGLEDEDRASLQSIECVVYGPSKKNHQSPDSVKKAQVYIDPGLHPIISDIPMIGSWGRPDVTRQGRGQVQLHWLLELCSWGLCRCCEAARDQERCFDDGATNPCLQSTHGYTITLAHEELRYGAANAIYSIFSCNHTTRPTFEPMSWDGRCFFDLSRQGFLCCSSEMAGKSQLTLVCFHLATCCSSACFDSRDIQNLPSTTVEELPCSCWGSAI